MTAGEARQSILRGDVRVAGVTFSKFWSSVARLSNYFSEPGFEHAYHKAEAFNYFLITLLSCR